MTRNLHIVDLFAGAGGTSDGALQAVHAMGRRPVLTAINHWPVAVQTHLANHPDAKVLCTGVDAVNPRELYRAGELDLLWASPECTHHSIARGGKPINDQSRATAWCVVRWAEAVRPPVILVENVPEFLTWGPCGTNGRPLVRQKGATFQAWVGALRSLGYRVEYRVLCAADYARWASRITLEIAAVRVERLQEIDGLDALCEGCPHHPGTGFSPKDAIDWYHTLWQSINGPGSWDANPWVWVIEFKRIKPE